jgi:hypothetical protein
VTRVLRVTDDPLDASQIAFSGIVHPNRFASVLVPNQGRSEENSKSMGDKKEAGIGKP